MNPMNVALWVLQVALAVQAVAGGAYKVLRFDDLAGSPAMGDLSRRGWGAVGVFEVACGVLLVVPAALGWMSLTVAGALALAVESFALAALYGRHSAKLSAENPLVYVVIGGLLATLVAVGRTAIAP
ncbi:MAG: hypothetical protein ABMB14_26125 [Myxococcota bacterium]